MTVEKGSFTPTLFDTTGGMAKEADKQWCKVEGIAKKSPL